jgi:hypothetical protein
MVSLTLETGKSSSYGRFQLYLPYDNRYDISVIMKLKRTQISLSENEYKLARQEASRRGISLAELFRQGMRSVLPVETDKPWMKYSGFISSGDPQASEKVDEVVYGGKE